MAKNMFSGASAPTAAATPVVPQGPEVLVATRAMPLGTIIDAESLRFQRWPEGLVEPAYFIKGKPGVNPAELIGTVVRNEISAGQPLTTGALIRPGERGFLAAALGPGMRAITVGVSTTSGVAGFVFPGDRVDLVLTQQVGDGEGPPLRASETIIRNIRVLATDNRTSAQDAEGRPVVRRTSTVTFEATPKIAEKIAVAQTIGSLSLALRPLADNNAELERAIASGEVTVPENGDAKSERKMLLAIAGQPLDTNTTFTTGSDVSRFQRSTVPSAKKPEPSTSQDKMADAIGSLAGAIGGKPAPSAEPAYSGPVVRVARGNNVTVVPVGAK
jgi:pilus assembly protein CpaB